MNQPEDVIMGIVNGIIFKGGEAAIQLAGKGTFYLSKNMLAFAIAAAKGIKRRHGRTGLVNLEKKYPKINVLSVDKNKLSQLEAEAKKYNVLYSVIENKQTKDVDVFFPENDAPKIERIAKRLEITNLLTGLNQFQLTPANQPQNNREEVQNNPQFNLLVETKDEQGNKVPLQFNLDSYLEAETEKILDEYEYRDVQGNNMPLSEADLSVDLVSFDYKNELEQEEMMSIVDTLPEEQSTEIKELIEEQDKNEIKDEEKPATKAEAEKDTYSIDSALASTKEEPSQNTKPKGIEKALKEAETVLRLHGKAEVDKSIPKVQELTK